MPKCEHHEICGRDADENSGEGFCILHSDVASKDATAFEEALAEHRRERGDNYAFFVFPGSTDFTKTKFSRLLNLYCAKFTGSANFSDAEFTKTPYFTYTQFAGPAYFIGTTFLHGADFTSATFAADARFPGARFSGKVCFVQAAFTTGADFSRASFNESNFSEARFKNARFHDARFGQRAGFEDSAFREQADFARATFENRADFSYARFKEANFGSVTFGDGNFYSTQFEEANFADATFKDVGNFLCAEFKKAEFKNTAFSKGVDFSLAKFTEKADFSLAHFCGRAVFSGAPWDATALTFSRAHLDFRHVIIEPLDALILRDADLRKGSLQGTDLRKAEITGAKWPKEGGRFCVYDEIVPLAEGENRAWSHIERLYRELKQNYEDRRDYERARDFHYGEKEMRRRNPDTALGLKILLFLYKWVSGYGERCLLPLSWAAVLFVLSAVCYLWLGLCPKGHTSSLSLMSPWDLLRSAFYSFRVMTLLRPDDLVPIGYAKIVHAFDSLLGPILLGLFALAIRQRLKR